MNRGTVIEENETGGKIKNSRAKRQPSEKALPRPDISAVVRLPAATLPVLSTEQKEGERKMPNTIATKAPINFETCPICGFDSKLANKTGPNGEQIKYLVCKGCNDKYLAYAEQIANQLAAGQKPEVLDKIGWVAAQLDLPRFERELETARKKRENIGERVDEKVRATINGKALPMEVLSALRIRYRKEISDEDYVLCRRLFTRLEAAKKLKLELEKKIAERTANATPGSS